MQPIATQGTIYGHVLKRCICINSVKTLECQSSLGMESGAISDGQISASSEHNELSAANRGRLHLQRPPSGIGGSWIAKHANADQWLQIDLGIQFTIVTRVATQGRNGHDRWVKMYRLQYSNDGVTFYSYKQLYHSVAKVNTLNPSKLC